MASKHPNLDIQSAMDASMANAPNRRLSIQTSPSALDLYSDSRNHGYQGPSRNVPLPRATPSGGGAIAKSGDGIRCAVTGKESLRIMRLSEPSQSHSPEHKSSVGRGGHRIDASRNFWEGSGLKIDSASTDVAWGHGAFNSKILTSARNGELIMWDLNKSGSTKYERRTKDHIRSIHKLSVSPIVQHYCITGSADGDLRVWDLRDMSKSLMRVHHPTSVRGVVFSPSLWQPLQAVVGLDNGSIYRWDLKMGQRGQLDRLPVAHTASVTSLDWCNSPGATTHIGTPVSGAGAGEGAGNGLGWIVSGGLDRCVKIWDLATPGNATHIPHKPTYTLHPSFPVRRVIWRPSYECEVAVVSNAEFGTGSGTDLAQGMGVVVSPGVGLGGGGRLANMSSALGSDLMNLVGFGSDSGMSGTETGSGSARGRHGDGTVGGTGASSGRGDAVEIWDVRRGWIAKWSVTGSAVEGGVTDIAFRDSHAIWAQHTSGMFSQIDLRSSTKPLDAIPRVATTWEASGILTFVSDRKTRWEVPYDDVKPDKRTTGEDRKSKLKALGDGPCVPISQNMGTFASDYSTHDLEVFTQLARGYVFEGADRIKICARNAQAAFQVGKDQAAQTWLLMGASLTNIVPDLPPTALPATSSNKEPSHLLPHSISAPAAIPGVYSFPPAPVPTSRTVDSAPAAMQKTSPGRTSVYSADPRPSIQQRRSSTSTSRRMTPTSSNSSSPHHLSSGLPPITPRQPSLLGRRESVDLGVSIPRRPLMDRRPSISTPSTHSASPIDKGNMSLRHVGEGALDDSDSSGSFGKSGDDAILSESSDEGSSLRPLISPALGPTGVIPANPSPLSRVAGQQRWTEDEDDGAKGGDEDDDDDEASSPSPRSTDTESGASSSPRRQTKSNRLSKRNSRTKSRSRSSTVARLAAPSFPRLMHHDSHSSIRTVTAGEVSFREQDSAKVLKAEETAGDVRPNHNRQKSQAMSELVLQPEPAGTKQKESSPDPTRWTERKTEVVRAEENKLREIGWNALREALEDFADEGDIQMCAMLSVVAPRELNIDRKRITRFLDAYIDLLTRLRLHTSTAYLRKYCLAEEVRNATLLETTIYTSCGKCRKPLVVPAGTQTLGEAAKGGYSYCLACKSSCAACAICRLPVRSLLFQCSVCAHGGHQACYRSYYMERPMVELPRSFPQVTAIRVRSVTRTSPLGSEGDDDDSSTTSEIPLESHSPVHDGQSGKFLGHPCAAGCGHFCWAVNGTQKKYETL